VDVSSLGKMNLCIRPNSVDPGVNINGEYYRTKVDDSDELKQRMLDVLCELGQSVINDAINEWRKRLRALFMPKENILRIYVDSKANTC